MTWDEVAENRGISERWARVEGSMREPGSAGSWRMFLRPREPNRPRRTTIPRAIQ
jgi:hypothetical protein